MNNPYTELHDDPTQGLIVTTMSQAEEHGLHVNATYFFTPQRTNQSPHRYNHRLYDSKYTQYCGV